MGSLDQESLFSLELVADSLTLTKSIACRFPAIAFRLLDFPTLIIYQLEPDLAEGIKRKLEADKHMHIPDQLFELKDKNGVFQIKKGKSCLFKVPPNVLLSHLQTTPLYVMLIDAYPSTPKLVGNCTVPLDLTMHDVYNDIKKLGLSVPSSHGEKGTYKVFNLMGKEIGQVTFGFRLLSLGVGLMSHIPDKSVMRMSQQGIVKQTTSATQAAQKPMEEEATEMILHDLETADKNVQVVVSAVKPQSTMSETQTDFKFQKIATTQTDKQKKQKKLQKEARKVNRVESVTEAAQLEPPADDLIVTNIYFPPPLFYNSHAQLQRVPSELTFDDYRVDQNAKDSDEESYDSDSTIRHEDIFEDTPEWPIKPTVTIVDEYPKPETKKPAKKPSKASDALTQMSSLSGFPLLSALMSEIISLHGTPGTMPQAQGGSGIMTQKSGRKVQIRPALKDIGDVRRTPSSSSVTKKPLRPVSPTRTFMLRKAMADARARGQHLEGGGEYDDQIMPVSQETSPEQEYSPEPLVSPRQRAHTVHSPRSPRSPRSRGSPRRHSAAPHSPRRHSAQAHSPRRQSLKSGTRSNKPHKSSVSAHSSSCLLPGMTRSQKLRLLKTNPKLLEKQEQEEKERVEKFRAKRMSMGAGFYSNHKQPNDDQQSSKVPKLQLHGSHKKPVPTPRMSIDHDESIVVKEVPLVVPRKSKRKTPRQESVRTSPQDYKQSATKDYERFEREENDGRDEEYEHYEAEDYDYYERQDLKENDREEEYSQGSHSASHAIDVRVPSARMDETYSDNEPEIKSQPPRKESRHKTRKAPQKKSRKKSKASNLGGTYTKPKDITEYSDDFEKDESQHNNPFAKISARSNPAAPVSDPVVVQYSDEFDDEDEDKRGSEMTGSAVGIEVMGLKRVVDTYTDSSEGDNGGEADELSYDETHENVTEGIDAGEALGLRRMVDTYSDHSDYDVSSKSSGGSFHSAKSSDSNNSMKAKSNLKVATSTVRTVAPPTSEMSPSVATKKPSLVNRNPLTESISTLDDSNAESTAFIHRSEMTNNSNFSSIESLAGQGTVESKSGRKSSRKPPPVVSPRKSLERVRTESVSSYAPSDPENAQLEEYSESFDSDEVDMKLQSLRAAKLAPAAKFGYTWSGPS